MIPPPGPGSETPTGPDRLQALARGDKWYLSCGDGVIWAPTFLAWPDCPGFWDEALVYYHPFGPLFAVALVSPDGRDVPLERLEREWRPDRLTTRWRTSDSLLLTEARCALPGGQLASWWSLADGTPWSASPYRGHQLVAYTAQPGETTRELSRSGNRLVWTRTVTDRRNVALDVEAALWAMAGTTEAAAEAVSVAAARSEGTAQPQWRHTPFCERWCSGGRLGLDDELRLDGVSAAGLVYVGLAVRLDGLGTDVGFVTQLVPAIAEVAGQDDERAAADDRTLNGVGKARRPLRGPPPDAAAPPPACPRAAAEWLAFFASFPRLRCSDQYVERYYDYRLYGLRLNRLAGGLGNVVYPAIAEGIGYFHVPITYSAQCHMWETRWCRDPSVAHGSLLNFLRHQKPDGSFHGRIYTNHLHGTDFYHANWGDAVLAVDAVHDDEGFLERSCDGLARYARWLDRSRDPGGSGMYDVVNHFETGQEYMSRYQAVCDTADRDGWSGTMRLKGIDVTVYAYQLKRALTDVAERLGRPEAAEWRDGAARTGEAIMQRMWDPESGFFTDVDPRTMAPTGVKAGVGFYPLLTDLLDDDTVQRLLEHLRNPDEFGTRFPVPSSSVDDPLFDPEARWKGKRHDCPWNGRVWPMVNSHVLEGLLRQWHAGRRYTGEAAADLLTRYVRMMFHDRDLSRPNCHEHYNPFTGHASVYRGIDDYQHSWVLDLIIRGVAGLQPTATGLLVDPLPLDLEQVTLDDARVRGHDVSISRRATHLVVTVDGRRFGAEVGMPLEVKW